VECLLIWAANKKVQAVCETAGGENYKECGGKAVFNEHNRHGRRPKEMDGASNPYML
jgi:hypothetical protein